MNACDLLEKFLRENMRGEDFGSAGMRGPLRVFTFDGLDGTQRLDVPPNAYIVVDGDFVGGGLAYEAAGNVTLPLVAGGIYSAPIDGRLYALRDDPDGRTISAAARLYVYGDRLSAELARSLIHARQLEELRDANTSLVTANASLASLVAAAGVLGGVRSALLDSGTFTNLAAGANLYNATPASWVKRLTFVVRITGASGTGPTLTLSPGITDASGNVIGSALGRPTGALTGAAGVGATIKVGCESYYYTLSSSLATMLSEIPVARGAAKNTLYASPGGTTPQISGTWEAYGEG